MKSEYKDIEVRYKTELIKVKVSHSSIFIRVHC